MKFTAGCILRGPSQQQLSAAALAQRNSDGIPRLIRRPWPPGLACNGGMQTGPSTLGIRHRLAARLASSCAQDARAQAALGLLPSLELPALLTHWRQLNAVQRPCTAGVGGAVSGTGEAGAEGAAPALP